MIQMHWVNLFSLALKNLSIFNQAEHWIEWLKQDLDEDENKI